MLTKEFIDFCKKNLEVLVRKRISLTLEYTRLLKEKERLESELNHEINLNKGKKENLEQLITTLEKMSQEIKSLDNEIEKNRSGLKRASKNSDMEYDV